MAFISREEVNGRRVHRLVWTDATKGAGSAGRRKVVCETGDHAEAMDAAELPAGQREALALGATSKPLRKVLLECYEALERQRAREAARLSGRQPRHDTPMTALVDAYLDLLEYRAALARGERPAPPENALDLWRSKAREKPLSPRTLPSLRSVFRRFHESLPAGMRTGDLEARTISGFLDGLLHAPGARPAAKTINTARGYLMAFLKALTQDATRELFRIDPRDIFRDEVEALASQAPEIVVYPAPTIARFLDAAEHQREPGRVLEVRRERGGRLEVFDQPTSSTPAPVLETALLLLCTGTRRGEALELRWADVDLDRGVVKIRATKTKTVRYVPLAGDPAGDVAPRFLALLRAWRESNPTADHVLPANGGEVPAFTKAWGRVAKAAGLEDFGPQGCRRTFESALACVGIPSTLAAFWLGHAPAVAHKHYLAFAPGRLPGRTAEEALGLVPFLERALERARAGRPFRVVGETTASSMLDEFRGVDVG